jgi:hypothetical protein
LPNLAFILIVVWELDRPWTHPASSVEPARINYRKNSGFFYLIKQHYSKQKLKKKKPKMMQILNLKKNLENNLADLTQVKLYNIIRSN